jgi:hypothetical protein
MINPPPGGIGWVLWAGTVGLESPVPARIEAALEKGCCLCPMSPLA